ncbi:MAG: hypothetical protein J7503_13965 [Cellulomonas iranensis]|uniref:HAAS signaling domain-containing protein n=1 Tax=Cellulomonas TaxID=1707 RepID=UPI0010710A39|nr:MULTISPECIES: hypothetical protein [Cellulomonas]MBO9569909.1 hypothetical protein [Cellulomonas iranensis]TFH70535.1 hypothetical protein E4A51_12205 [Cellulomonas sp. HD19AZ1]
MTPVSSPLVAAYLADLERRLADVPATERLDVLDAVREHLDLALAELGPRADDADVRRVLAELGSVDQVAAAMHDGTTRPPLAPTPPDDAGPTPGVVVLLVLGGLVLGPLAAPVAMALALAHPALLVGALVLAAAVVAWTGYRAFARRAPRPRRRWRIAFAVLLPAALTATVTVLLAVYTLPFVAVEESTGGTVQQSGVVVEDAP